VARCAPEGVCTEPLHGRRPLTEPIAVRLVSDDPVLRAAWARGLPASDVVEAAADQPPTVILLDAGERAGPELIRGVGEARLVVVGPPETAAVRAVLDAGARGYLFGRADPERPPTEDWMRVRTASGSVTELSRREIDVLQGVADGRSNGDLAADLQISPLTVKSHLARVARKLGAGDRAHAVLLALRARVIT
jgi:DNA-binding NarL/FixJ family response regulator